MYLNNEPQEIKELIKCVLELDIDETTKNSVLDFIRKGQSSKGILLLRQYRGKVLGYIHNSQDKLYQIDYVLQKIK